MADALVSLVILGLVTIATLIYLSISPGTSGKKPLKLPIIGDLHCSLIEKPLLRWGS